MAVIFTACQNNAQKKTNDLRKLDWLIGTWIDSSAEDNMYEIWEKVDDNSFAGKSYMIADSDTVFFETMALQQSDSGLFYIPTVKDQNEGKPVSFRFVSDSAGEFVFENKTHDFPQRVVYSNPHPERLHAWIEGNDKGRNRREDFILTKQ